MTESPRLRLRVSEEAWEETYHELPKRAEKIVEQGRITQEEGHALLRDALDVATLRVATSETYEALKVQAAYRIPRDPDDIPTVALALALGGDEGRCGIWTGDNDFLGCGIPTWTTDTYTGALALHGAGLKFVHISGWSNLCGGPFALSQTAPVNGRTYRRSRFS